MSPSQVAAAPQARNFFSLENLREIAVPLAVLAIILALITPAGIGVREAVMTVGLAPVLGVTPAASAAIVSRLTSLLVDVAAWGVGRFIARRG